MQLQIECNSSTLTQQTCILCSQSFQLTNARVIVCNDKGNDCGDICPHCIAMGPDRLWKNLGSKLINPRLTQSILSASPDKPLAVSSQQLK